MANADDPGLGARLMIGGIAGLVATLAFTSAVRRLKSRADRQASAPSLLPFAYGAAAGALLAAANPRPGRVTGLAAGGGLWLAGEVGLLPEIAIGPVSGRAARRSIALLAGHLAWGWSAAEALKEISER
jgi:hypothetical protein